MNLTHPRFMPRPRAPVTRAQRPAELIGLGDALWFIFAPLSLLIALATVRADESSLKRVRSAASGALLWAVLALVLWRL